MTKNLELKLTLSADNKGLRAEVTGARDEVEKLSGALGDSEKASDKGAKGVKSVGDESVKADRKLSNLNVSVRDLAKRAAALGAVGATAAIGGLALMTKKGLENVDAQAKLSRSLDATVTGVRAVQLAASDGGVDNMAMGLARLNRRLGAAEMGVGEYAKAVEALGLDLDELRGVDADERLAMIADAVRDSGLSAQETARHVQTLGFEQANANQFFRAGGDAIRAARREVEDYGLGLNEVDTAKVEQANDAWARIGLVTESLQSHLAIQLAPVIENVAKQFSSAAKEAGGMGNVVVRGAEGTLTAIKFVMNGADGVGRVFDLAGVTVANVALLMRRQLLRVADVIINGPVDAINKMIGLGNQAITWANKMPGVEFDFIEGIELNGLGQRVRDELDQAEGALDEGLKDLKQKASDLFNEPLAGSKRLDQVIEGLGKVGDAANQAGKPMSNAVGAGQAAGILETNLQIAESRKAMDALRRAVDPAYNRMQQLSNAAAIMNATLQRGDIDQDQFKEYYEAFVAQMDKASSEASVTVEKDFERAMESVAASLTDALISGDWEGTGQQIGSVLGSSIAAALSAGNPIAMVIGGAIGGSLFGGNDDTYVDPTADRQARQNTGDVLGGINDKSQSIAEATQQTADALGELIGVNRELLAAQQGADQSIGAFAAAAAPVLGEIQDAPGVRDVGIQFGPSGAEFYASGKGFGKNAAAAVEDIANQITDLTTPFDAAIGSIGDVLVQSADALGIELSGEFSAALLDLGKISLDDLSAEEFIQVIGETFGTGLNQAADQLIPDIREFVDEVGESSGQVLQKFARNATVVDSALLGLNDSLADLTGLELGDAATNLVDVFGDAAGLASASQRLADEFLSDEKKAELNEQKLRKELDQLNEKYKDLNIQLPETKDGVADLIYGLDLKTEAGRAALEVFTRSSGALVEFYQTAETGATEALASIQSATDAAYSAFSSSANQRISDINEQLAAERAALQAQKNSAIEAAHLSTESARTRVRAIENELRDIESAYDRLAQQSGVGLDRDTAFKQLQLAASGGSLTDLGEALAVAQNISAQDFGTAVDYDREQRKFLAVLEQVEDKDKSQLSTAERQLAASNRQISVIEDSFDEQIMTLEDAAEEEQKRLQELLDDQQDQLNQLRGIDTSVQSVDQSIKALQAAIIAERNPRPTELQAGGMAVQGWGRPDGSHAAGLNRVPFDGYRAELHRDEMVLTADVANTVRRAVSGGHSQEALLAVMRRAVTLLESQSGYMRNISVASSSAADSIEEMARMGVYARAR